MIEQLSQQIIETLFNIATADISDFTTCSACTLRIKDMSEIDPKKRSAIREITQNKGKISIKLHDKTAALKMLGESLGLFGEFNLALATLRKYGIFLTLDPQTNTWSVREEITPSLVE
ncbi:MAG: terminase small subunit [Spirirestis rafaelensis WJT71-NPBG6]|jgi:hypothetical protein|nr:terminase small subunit [Spirirestis rafaelensis WJT71-NPBG6]